MSCFIEPWKINKSLSVPSPEEPPIQHSQPEPLVEGSHVMQATSNKSRVLPQVIPVTLYGPCSQLNAHALLDPGSTCSLVRGDVADQLNLDGPTTSLDLFGIQVTSHFKRSEFHLTLVLLMKIQLVIWWKMLWLQRN